MSAVRGTHVGVAERYVASPEPGVTRLASLSGDVFDRRVDAERYLTTVEASTLTGSYIDAETRLDPLSHRYPVCTEKGAQ
jgi:hypothetical protein